MSLVFFFFFGLLLKSRKYIDWRVQCTRLDSFLKWCIWNFFIFDYSLTRWENRSKYIAAKVCRLQKLFFNYKKIAIGKIPSTTQRRKKYYCSFQPFFNFEMLIIWLHQHLILFILSLKWEYHFDWKQNMFSTRVIIIFSFHL